MGLVGGFWGSGCAAPLAPLVGEPVPCGAGSLFVFGELHSGVTPHYDIK